MMNLNKTRAYYFTAAAASSVACTQPPTLEATIRKSLAFQFTAVDDDVTEAVCGWPVKHQLKMTATRFELIRRAGATKAEGTADFTIDTKATTPDGTHVMCAGVGTLEYKQRQNFSHGSRGRDYYAISNVRRSNRVPDSIVRLAATPPVPLTAKEVWLPVSVQASTLLPDGHPAAAVHFQIEIPGQYQMRIRAAAGTTLTSIANTTAYQGDRLVFEGNNDGSLSNWQLAQGPALFVIDSALPANAEVQLSAY